MLYLHPSSVPLIGSYLHLSYPADENIAIFIRSSTNTDKLHQLDQQRIKSYYSCARIVALCAVGVFLAFSVSWVLGGCICLVSIYFFKDWMKSRQKLLSDVREQMGTISSIIVKITTYLTDRKTALEAATKGQQYVTWGPAHKEELDILRGAALSIIVSKNPFYITHFRNEEWNNLQKLCLEIRRMG